jgi:hypothetical protein
MLNADNASVLTASLNDLSDKNLFSYCDNNPVMREDSDGDFWGFALAGGGALGASWSFGGANFWNPVGWVILGVATVATVTYAGYTIYKMSKGGKQRIRDTGLAGVSDEEIASRLTNPRTSKSEKQKLKKEQKARGDRNKQKRGKKK